jgi:hypothetical protein
LAVSRINLPFFLKNFSANTKSYINPFNFFYECIRLTKEKVHKKSRILLIIAIISIFIISSIINPVSAAPDTFGNTNIESSYASIEDTIRGSKFAPGSSGFAESITAYIDVDLDFAFGNLDTTTDAAGDNIINTIRGSRFTCDEDGFLGSITAYIKVEGNAKRIKGAIYNRDTNTFMSQTEEILVNPTPNPAWVTFNFLDPKPYVTAGTSYMLVVWSEYSSGSANLWYNGGCVPGQDNRYSATYGSSWPTSPTWTTDWKISVIYCSYLSSLTFGYTAPGDYSTTILNQWKGSIHQCPSDGNIESITAYIHCTSASKNMRARIYEIPGSYSWLLTTWPYPDWSAVPIIGHTMIGETQVVSVSPGGFQWVTFNFASPPAVTGGNFYALVVYSEPGSGSADLRWNNRFLVDPGQNSPIWGGWGSNPTSFFAKRYNDYIWPYFLFSVYCTYEPPDPIPRNIKAAIYSEAGSGSPHDLIASTEEVTVSTSGWITLNFPDPKPIVTAGTDYILTAWSDSGAGYVGMRFLLDSPDDTGHSLPCAYNSWPDPANFIHEYFCSTPKYTKYSIYSTYTPSGTIKVIKDSVPDDPQDFDFIVAGGTTTVDPFTLHDDGVTPLHNSIEFAVVPGIYTVTETPIPPLWKLANILIGDPSGGSLLDLSTATATLDVTAGETVTVTFTNTPRFDFGDAPDPAYPTLSGSGGARHVIGNIWLGATIDGETVGQQSVGADGDDASGQDDEDGVVFPSLPFIIGSTGYVGITVSELTAGTITPDNPAYLHGWIDWNQDGDWDDYLENIISSEIFTNPGSRNIGFSVPGNAKVGSTYARFRLDDEDFRDPTGQVDNGEVEDYLLDPAVARFLPRSPPLAVGGVRVPVNNLTILAPYLISSAIFGAFSIYLRKKKGVRRARTKPVK